jgi:hypothetical protein
MFEPRYLKDCQAGGVANVGRAKTPMFFKDMAFSPAGNF